MSNNKRRGRAYRIIAITIAFVLLGLALFIPLMMMGNRNEAVIYTLLSVFLVAYVGVVVINEIVIYKRNKKQ